MSEEKIFTGCYLIFLVQMNIYIGCSGECFWLVISQCYFISRYVCGELETLRGLALSKAELVSKLQASEASARRKVQWHGARGVRN